MSFDEFTPEELLLWSKVEPLDLETAVRLAIGGPPNFPVLLKAAETALERGELQAANDWHSHMACAAYGSTYIEAKVKQDVFRAWLDNTLAAPLRDRAFFFLSPIEQWPVASCWQEEHAPPTDKPLGSRERSNLLVIISALAELAKVDLSHHQKAGGALAVLLDAKGVKLTGRTVGDHFKAAREEMDIRQKE